MRKLPELALQPLIKTNKRKRTRKRTNREDNKMKKKKWTSEENKLASMLAWVCCHADEDCPSEYRTKHFRQHLKDAIDYLENSGWYNYNQQASKQQANKQKG